jgi:hypothetical protein
MEGVEAGVWLAGQRRASWKPGQGQMMVWPRCPFDPEPRGESEWDERRPAGKLKEKCVSTHS